MSSSFTTCLKIKQCLASKENNPKIVFLIISCFIIGILLLFDGLKELYKIETLVIGQCQVKSIDLKSEKDNVYPLWFIKILHDNQKSENIIIGSTGYLTRYKAWHAAHDYRINETHPCYRWKNLISTSTISWQWSKPPESNIGIFLFSGITLLVLGIIIPILRRRYQTEFGLNQQQQIEIRLTTQQSSPPSYDEAIQSLTPTTIQTRI